jgi:hypothetical protein
LTRKTDGLLKIIRYDDFVKSSSSRRANLVSRDALAVRRSDNEMKRNAEIEFFYEAITFLKLHNSMPRAAISDRIEGCVKACSSFSWQYPQLLTSTCSGVKPG